MTKESCDALIVGGGLAGLVSALALLRRGRRVTLLDRRGHAQLGGLAYFAFGGMALVGTPQQRWAGIADSQDLALADWLRFARFAPDDICPVDGPNTMCLAACRMSTNG